MLKPAPLRSVSDGPRSASSSPRPYSAAYGFLKGHPAISATAHAILAQIFFITIVSLTLYLSPWWQRDLPLLDDSRSPSVRSIAAWTTFGIFVQLILGAGFRHGAWGINPHIAWGDVSCWDSSFGPVSP